MHFKAEGIELYKLKPSDVQASFFLAEEDASMLRSSDRKSPKKRDQQRGVDTKMIKTVIDVRVDSESISIEDSYR